MVPKNIYLQILYFVAFIVICYLPIFLYLDVLPIHIWDESRNALNAMHMCDSGNYFVRYFNGAPDLWELKPPMMEWLQCFFFKTIGYTELSVRLPSALSAFTLILLMIQFAKKELGNIFIGFFATLVLLTSQGFVGHHVVRTGDHDALLVLFMFIGFMNFFKFVKYDRPKYLIYLSIALIFSTLTKSVAGLFFLPGIVIYTFHKRKVYYIVTKKAFYISIVLFVLFIFGYYLMREYRLHGYLKMVYKIDMWGRYLTKDSTFDNGTIFYYISNMIEGKFITWFFVMLFAILIIFNNGNEIEKEFTTYALTCGGMLILIISFALKKDWYDAPLYPLFSLISGIGICYIYQAIVNFLDLKNEYMRQLCFIGFVFAIFYMPYSVIIEKVSAKKVVWEREQYGEFFKQMKTNPMPNKMTIVHSPYNSQVLFYKEILKRQNQVDIYPTEDYSKFSSGEVVMSCESEITEKIDSLYDYILIEKYRKCKLVKISDFKNKIKSKKVF